MSLTSSADRRRRVLEWIAIALVVPSVVLFVGVSLFVAITEYAHDESRCPFERVGERTLVDGTIVVQEDRRSCVEGVEERRWIVRRPDRGPREVARRRLSSDFFEPSRYRWRAALEDDWVHIRIENDGVSPAVFREGPE